jgi:predicted GNAT superfamily acetyltransferase
MIEQHPIQRATAAQQSALLALNNLHAKDTSFLTSERWAMLVNRAFYAAYVKEARGFVIAFDQAAAYDSPNFLWFRDRFERFVYVDRIIVDASQRSGGIARALYESLFELARGAGQPRVCCEVNRVPPNPGSDAFHARLGFEELDTVTVGDDGKTVRYLVRDL